MHGRALVLDDRRLVLGRLPTSDLRLDDPHVSKTHAAVDRSTGRTVLEDLGSTGGTSVNGVPLDVPRFLRHGDRVGFSVIETRYEEPVGAAANTLRASFPPVTPPVAAPTPPVLIDVDRQDADNINNVARDQHNQWVQQIRQERESFLVTIAATKTWARRLVLIGFVMVVGGALACVSIMLGDMPRFDELQSSGQAFGLSPIFSIGFGVGFVGQFILIAGIVLHIVVAARRRRLEQNLPLPSPSAPPDMPYSRRGYPTDRPRR